MAKFFPPTITTAQRTAFTPDKGEIMFDSDLDTFYLGDGSTLGGITLKGDDGDIGPPGPLGSLEDDTSPQLGGFLDTNGNYIGMGKGGDIASGSPLVVDVDGDYFDVTGTNGFSSMTVATHRFFILEFDGVLTITHGGSISLPGAANFTTASGDHLLCFSTAANTVRVVAITKADGTPVVSESFNLVDDTTPQLGGFLDTNGHYVESSKGGNLASASPLVIGVDGDYFDVTGTINFATMTVAQNRLFRLHFDGVLTITHGVDINLPGGVNFITTPGDEITFFSTITSKVRVVSIVKADGTAVVSSGLSNFVEDPSPQCGGFIDPNSHYIGSDKGSDIASASPLVIGTDGDYFDVTGTTGFTSITVASNRLFRLHFDGVLSIIHGGSIALPGGVNFTTAAGDELTFFSTAANTVRVVAITKADGTAVVSSGGGAWNLIGTVEASNDSTLTITGLDSTYDTYAIGLSDLDPASTPNARLRVGDINGIDIGSTDYEYVYNNTASSDPTVYNGQGSQGSSFIQMGGSPLFAFGAMLFIHNPGNSNSYPSISGTCSLRNTSNGSQLCTLSALRTAVIVLDRVQFFFSSGNILTGRMTVWGISHE